MHHSQVQGIVAPVEKITKSPSTLQRASEMQEWPALGGSAGAHRMAGRRQMASILQPVIVTSWYDSGIRLMVSEIPCLETSEVPRLELSEVVSWYDTGIRLNSGVQQLSSSAALQAKNTRPAISKEKEDAADAEALAKMLNAEVDEEAAKISAEATLAAGAVAAIATLGVDLASIDAAAHVDLALFAAGLVASQGDNRGPLGQTIRTVGNLVERTMRVTNNFVAENELGLKSRAVLEVAVEEGVKAARNRQLEAKKKAAAEAAELAVQAKAAAEEAAAAKRFKWPF